MFVDTVLDLHLERFNSWTLFLLLFCLGILIAISRIKAERPLKEQVVRLNCWFCCQDVDIKCEKGDSWTCPFCDQYNGFNKDGDYSQPVKEHFDVKEYKTPTVCLPSDFMTAKSVLCETCSQNQLLKIRQLAAFIPLCEANHDEEVDQYSDYLESRYSLCDMCRKQVSHLVNLQDQRLAETMTSEHLHLLDQLKRNTKSFKNNDMAEQIRPQQSAPPHMMFMLCACAGVVHAIIGLAHSSASELILQSYILPVELLPCGEQACVYLGAVFCTLGLLIAGKNSLYPLDALHLVLWLLLIFMTSNLPTSFWLNVTSEKVLFVDAGTVSVSVICCLRKRLPRHLMTATVQKKQIYPPDTPMGNKQKLTRGYKESESTSPLSSNQVSSANSDSNNGGVLHLEYVQQNLESLSLGLTKKSRSTSSIWSLPAIVSTSTTSAVPDSTTDNSFHVVQQSQSILSPSKLGFLNLDLVLRDRKCSSLKKPVLLPHNRFTLINNNRKKDQAQTHHSSCLVQSEPDLTDHTLFSAVRVSTAHTSTVFQNSGPCDSQTPDSLLQLPSVNRFRNYQNTGSVSENKTSSFTDQNKHSKTTKYRSHAKDMQNVATPVAYGGYGSIFSRPSLLSMTVTSSQTKPWPLKKSLSCGSLWSQEIRHGMPILRNGGLPDMCKQNTSDSTNSRLAPIHEATVYPHAAVGSVIPEFSDDEYDGDNLGTRDKNILDRNKEGKSDVSWHWLLVGFVMGASLASNIFLMYHSWLTHVK